MIPIKDLNPTHRRPVVTLLLVAACAAVYFLVQQAPSTRVVDTPGGPVAVPQALGSTFFALEYAAIPCEVVTGQPLAWQEIEAALARGDDTDCRRDAGPEAYPGKNVYLAVVVSMFLHGSVMHLLGNLLFLWIFGNNIEDRLGRLPFLAFYLFGGVAATAAHIAVEPSSTIPLVGASGAIAAVMGAYLVWFPNAPVLSWVVPFFFVPVRAKWFLVVWFVLQFFTDPTSGVAWVAHVAGFVAGVLVGLALRGRRPMRPPGLHPSPHQRW